MSDMEIFVQSMFCFSSASVENDRKVSEFDDWVEKNNKKAAEIINLYSQAKSTTR